MRLLARVTGIGIETADLLVHELLLRNMRDRRAVARYGGLTGSPDRSGGTNREKGMARSGNARVRRGMIQLAWRFLLFQKNSALAQWYRRRTDSASSRQRLSNARRAFSSVFNLLSGWRSTPGTIPATNQLDRLNSITAINVVSMSRARGLLLLGRPFVELLPSSEHPIWD